MTDFWAAYLSFDTGDRQYCLVHLRAKSRRSMSTTARPSGARSPRSCGD
ncbi:MAG: hypothetical protein HS102_12655 [Planctomycetia bacterium]|nr:hypothetical protein [Planctomycetia bacterium]